MTIWMQNLTFWGTIIWMAASITHAVRLWLWRDRAGKVMYAPGGCDAAEMIGAGIVLIFGFILPVLMQ
jgi:hypothetical protein